MDKIVISSLDKHLTKEEIKVGISQIIKQGCGRVHKGVLHITSPLSTAQDRVINLLSRLKEGGLKLRIYKDKTKPLHKDMSDPAHHTTDQNPEGLKTSFNLIKFLSEGKKLEVCEGCGFPKGYHPCTYFGGICFHDNFSVDGKCFGDVIDKYTCSTCNKTCYCDNPEFGCGR